MIPIATTTVTIRGIRPQSDSDPDGAGYDVQPTPTDLATGVRASITLPIGRRSNPTDEIDSYTLRCDPVVGGLELTRHDTVVDESTGDEYQVHVVNPSVPDLFGLQHWVATIKRSKGVVRGGETNESTGR